MIIRRTGLEFEQPSVIRIADDWRGAIGFQVVADEFKHSLQLSPVPARNLEAVGLTDRKEKGEDLYHEPVIANRAFIIHAVREHLAVHLSQQTPRAVAHPSASFA